MSEYTTELRYICELAAGLSESVGFNDVDSVLEKAWDKIFSFDFPIYSENYRKELCKKILLHFYTQEIAYETPGLWKLHLQAKMQEIMPYYNRMYKVLEQDFEPLENLGYTIATRGDNTDTVNDDRKISGSETSKTTGTNTSAGTTTGTRTTTDTNSDNSGDAYSNTPQGGLDDVEKLKYLTEYRNVKNSHNGTSNDTTSETDNKTDTIEHNVENSTDTSDIFTSSKHNIVSNTVTYQGRSVPVAELIEKYFQSLRNIDELVIGELDCLFMSIF